MSREFMSITSKIVLNDGQSLIDKDIFIPANFAWDTAMAPIVIQGKGCTLRNVKLYTYVPEFLESWMDDPVLPVSGFGIPWKMCGIRANAARALALENVHIEGFPSSGFLGYSCEDVTMRRVSATRCFTGYAFTYVDRVSKRVRVDGMEVYDTWGPGPGAWPGVGGAPSIIRPGYFMGGDGFAGYIDDFVFNHCNFHGEMYAAWKVVRSKRGYVTNLRGNQFYIQGTVTRYNNGDATTDGSEDIYAVNIDVDKSYGKGETTDLANGVQISWNVVRCGLLNSRFDGTGEDGHGIQLSGDCEVEIRGNTIGGFNQLRGVNPAYAIHVNDGSSVNADVLTVNTFTNQQRLLLTN